MHVKTLNFKPQALNFQVPPTFLLPRNILPFLLFKSLPLNPHENQYSSTYTTQRKQTA